ncbi:MAG: ClbS/DfsB family four-helix bundle protein [Candidatus Dormiibacterota bacterium]
MTESERVRERVDESWTDLWELVDSMGPETLATTGPDGWAVKDHLAHVAAWEESLLAIFDGRDRIEAMGLGDVEQDTDAVNAAVWLLHRDRSSGDAVAYFRDSHARLMARLEGFDDAGLELPYFHYQPAAKGEENSDLPVIEWIAGNTYEHYLEHIDWIKNLVSQRI